MGRGAHAAVSRGGDEGSPLALVDARLVAPTTEATEHVGQRVDRRGIGPQRVAPREASLPADHLGVVVAEVLAADSAVEPVPRGCEQPGQVEHVGGEHWNKASKKERKETISNGAVNSYVLIRVGWCSECYFVITQNQKVGGGGGGGGGGEEEKKRFCFLNFL